MQKRTAALIAGSAAAVAMTITGVTYASADSAQSAREAVRPASAPLGGDSDHEYKHEYKDEYKKDKDYRGYKKDGGQIQINERTYSANPGACVSVTNFLGTQTFNISNDTDRVVQFFDGTNCNDGNPAAVVLPGDSAFGVDTNSVDGSFRVIDN